MDLFDENLDNFEESLDETTGHGPRGTGGGGGGGANVRTHTFNNDHYDEAIEFSADQSMMESIDYRNRKAGGGAMPVHLGGGPPTVAGVSVPSNSQSVPQKHSEREYQEKRIMNERYDEAIDVSQSLDSVALGKGAPAYFGGDHKGEKPISMSAYGESKATVNYGNTGENRSSSRPLVNEMYDEAFEFSRGDSDDESIETTRARDVRSQRQQEISAQNRSQPPTTVIATSQPQAQISSAPQAAAAPRPTPLADRPEVKQAPMSGDEESSAGGDAEESYDNIEGAYKASDFKDLPVSKEVRDLFQYIDRYKPQEVELDTPLKCFIPEYIPSIGELDAMLKIPRPDGREDGCGLRFLDEPIPNQSDPSVLELQLRAKSKKLQYGDVVVRSIEYAEKNPSKIDKWINDINDLHRSKPPPQVNYKKNMPELDRLMEVWPEELEKLFSSTELPSPDLDLTLSEYTKALCAILDIPVYDNPVESLHLMFTLYLEFKNNPHFQSRIPSQFQQADSKVGTGVGAGALGHKIGGADVFTMDGDYK